jgi:hypothetical protein
MKAIAVIVLMIASGLAVHFANGASIGDRPAGIDAKNWIPVSDKMGFVVTTPNQYPSAAPAQALLLTPPAEGYFMVRVGNGWRRIIIDDPIKGSGSSG